MVDELKRRLREEEEEENSGGGGVVLPPIDRESFMRERSSSSDEEGDAEAMEAAGKEEGKEAEEGVNVDEEGKLRAGAGDLMAQPEFQGMWEAKAESKLEKKKKAAIAEGGAVGTQFAKSKMEVDILNK